MTPLGLVVARLKGVSADGKSALCPAHDDHRRSLSIGLGKDGQVLLKCHAGCSLGEILQMLGLELRDLWPSNGTVTAKASRTTATRPRVVARYDYRDEAGKFLFQVERLVPKDFRQRRPEGKAGWIYNLEGVRRVLYRLHELRAAPTEEWVFIPEGEKDADALGKLGLVATTNPGGAGKWSKLSADLNPCFAGRSVAVLPDNDETGRKHAREVAASLREVAAEVRIVELPGLPPKGDVSDWLAAGGTVEELKRLVREAEPDSAEHVRQWADKDAASRQQQGQLDERQNGDDQIPTPAWPEPPAAEAFYGLAGDVVRLIEPQTEADSVALLVQLLVAFGNVIGRAAHFTHEATTHALNLFVVLVGETAKARKGTAWDWIKRLFSKIDPTWESRVMSGLSSGEGLIYNVRDPGQKDDAGISDKRLLAIQPEFAATLRVMERDGSTLSTTIRQAWDSGDLRTMVRNNPQVATGAHVSLVGHVTAPELRRYLTRTEAANGFANRFMWMCVKRSKFLPEGGTLGDSELEPLSKRLRVAIEFARSAGEIRRDIEAKRIWRGIYRALSEGKPGLLGSVISRGEPMVMRLASLHALLDLSPEIRRVHLEAALALWDYAEESARFIFGDSLGDPFADEILRSLRQVPNGLSRTEIHGLFGNHKRAEEIGRALGELLQKGLAKPRNNETNGRTEERWFAEHGAKDAKEAKQAPESDLSSPNSLSSQAGA